MVLLCRCQNNWLLGLPLGYTISSSSLSSSAGGDVSSRCFVVASGFDISRTSLYPRYVMTIHRTEMTTATPLQATSGSQVSWAQRLRSLAKNAKKTAAVIPMHAIIVDPKAWRAMDRHRLCRTTSVRTLLPSTDPLLFL